MAKSTPSKPSKSAAPQSPQPKSQDQVKFEKDLQALAAKAKSQTSSRWALNQAWIITQSAILLGLAAIYANVSRLTLSPVYGGIPSSIYHDKVVITAMFLGWSCNLYLKRYVPVNPKFLLPVVAAYIPAVQFFMFKYSGKLGGKWGPVITEGVTLWPLLFLSVANTGNLLEDLELKTGRRFAFLSDALPGISSFVFFKSVEYVSDNFISRTIGQSLVQTRLGLQVLLQGLYTIFAPSRLLALAIPGLLHTALYNTHLQTPYHTNLLNDTMAKSEWQLFERKESVTGYVAIAENLDRGFRVMRCDHSLLGGEWQPSVTKSPKKETIYGIFVLLEAIRLIERPEMIADKDAKALVVGLGIGTTPKAFHAHGINTTIVEIDPVVHEFAVKYFDFPPEINAKLTDAVSYTTDLVAEGVEKFDYIVHDVFTGGAEPIDLFTVEFISNLKSLLTPNGVVAINFAGDLLLPSARIVIHTIFSVFSPHSHTASTTPPNCRIYRESEVTTKETAAQNKELDFTNMVIFCINTDTSISEADATPTPDDLDTDASKPSDDQKVKPRLRFRRAEISDLLDSPARRAFLYPKFEIQLDAFGTIEDVEEVGGLLYKKGAHERFNAWHESSALGHWNVMRTVLEDVAWENW